MYRWVQRFTPEFIEAARPCRHAPGDRWFADETSVKVAGKWTYLYRAIDQHRQVIDVLLSARRDLAAARRFFTRALRAGTIPVEVTTDRAHVYLRVLDELVLSALHVVEQDANNPIEADHGRLKAWLWPMRGLKRHRSARILLSVSLSGMIVSSSWSACTWGKSRESMAAICTSTRAYRVGQRYIASMPGGGVQFQRGPAIRQ